MLARIILALALSVSAFAETWQSAVADMFKASDDLKAFVERTHAEKRPQPDKEAAAVSERFETAYFHALDVFFAQADLSDLPVPKDSRNDDAMARVKRTANAFIPAVRANVTAGLEPFKGIDNNRRSVIAKAWGSAKRIPWLLKACGDSLKTEQEKDAAKRSDPKTAKAR